MLAAGASSRLGRPKQLVPFRGATLLGHAVQTALQAQLGPVVVVLGSEAEACRQAVPRSGVTVVVNTAWPHGLGSTIRAGVEAALATHHATHVLLTTCDQPGVTPDHLQRLATEQLRTGKEMAASAYGGTVGVPALFAGLALEQLRDLSGDQGAKRILEAAADRLVAVPCPLAATDIDTESDVAALA